ncbi:MAG TPA: DUF6734 family protein [Mucilaginibacter sp.]|jgi:hypothetical protein|nr:DUF6734 family protein [Mucilaginibacter sp.]
MNQSVRIIQTLYLKKDENPVLNACGFLSAEFNWMSWALSCLQLHNIYGKVELYTNNAGKEVLIDQLKLPYTKVHVVLNEIDFPELLWAYPKLYTYSLQQTPFIHVDGDVFIWEKLIEPDHKKHLVVQNIENADYYYRAVITDLLAKNFLFPKIIQKEIDNSSPFLSVNAGIIGGADLAFFKEYTSLAFQFINNNIEKINAIDQIKFNMIFEQYFFYCLAQQKGIEIKCQIPEMVTDITYKELLNFFEVPYQTKYIHMAGSYKNSNEACVLLAKRLRQSYPDFYYNIIDKCKKAGIKPFFNYYRENECPTDNMQMPEGYSFNKTSQINWARVYEIESEQHSMIENTFNDISNLTGSYFQTNQYLLRTSVSTTNDDEKISYEVPHSYMKAYKKLECDDLDDMLIELLQVPKSFKEIYNELECAIDEDVKGKEEILTKLIELKLKNGCISNLYLKTNIKL